MRFSQRLNQFVDPDPNTSTVPKRWAVVNQNLHDSVSLLVTGHQAGRRGSERSQDAVLFDR